MKFLTQIFRISVAIFFVISGFVKLNDPLGFSYKLQEYFSPDVLNLTFLAPYALIFSFLIVVFEVVVGVFLFLGFKTKFTLWSLLSMILFFTFLTFYSAYFDKVKDCGCFGDALKLSPWESFFKDLVLLILIVIIFIFKDFIKPFFSTSITNSVAVLSLAMSIFFGFYVLRHLPLIDFRAYKIGDSIINNMSIPPNAPKGVQEFKWKFRVNDSEEVFITNGSYPEVNGDYIGVETRIIEEGYQPPILDFSIESDNENLTETYLAKDKLLIIVSYDLNTANIDGLKKLKEFTDDAISKGYTVIGLSASGMIDKNRIKSNYGFNFKFYLCDEKVLKTIVRSNPGILHLNKGTVIQKTHWNDIEDILL